LPEGGGPGPSSSRRCASLWFTQVVEGGSTDVVHDAGRIRRDSARSSFVERDKRGPAEVRAEEHRARWTDLVRFFPPLRGNTHPTAAVRCPQVLFAHHATSLAPQGLEIHWHPYTESFQLLFDRIQTANQAARIVSLGASALDTTRKLLRLHQHGRDRSRK